MERNIIYLDTVDSTNSYLKRLAKNGAKEGTIVLAKEQTQGKGRKGRSFQSEQNMGIYMSVLWKPQCELSQLSEVTAWVAVAVARAIEGVTKVSPGIKWVNDILIASKKVCGILTEGQINPSGKGIDFAILGIGINVYPPEEGFDEEIKDIAGSLISGNDVENNKSFVENLKNRLIAEILTKMYKYYNSNDKAFMDEYKNKSILLNKDIYILGDENKEKWRDIDIEYLGRFGIEIPDGLQIYRVRNLREAIETAL